MVIYERGNAAKQWIFLELARLAQDRSLRVLDLACGDGRLWRAFLERHANVSVVGVDTDANAIARGRDQYAHPRLKLEVLDAQTFVPSETFDVVVAFSAVEHVVDRFAFLRTVWNALSSQGVAYLNYDAGHFRSWDLKERVMVPVSQLLAAVGIEGSYMKPVKDEVFIAQAEQLGFMCRGVRKHNLHPLKGFFRGGSDEVIRAWVEFEERLNTLYPASELDRIMWSTTVLLQKP